jgi:hypothetical protein
VQTLIEHWDGTSWRVVPSPNSDVAFLKGIAAVAANDVWAVGDGAGTLIEHWDGTSWNVVPSPNPGSEAFLNGVVAVAANDVWAVGEGWYAPYRSQALIEHWNGTSWSIVPSPNPGMFENHLSGIAVLSANPPEGTPYIWAVGHYRDSFDSPSRTLVLHGHGSGWGIEPSPNPGTDLNELYGVAPVSANDVWAVGDYSNSFAGPSQTLVERYSELPFTDVHTSDYFYQAVRYLYCHGVISGYADATFRPYNLTTRAQFSKIVVLAEGWTLYSPPFPTFRDVPPTDPFYTYIETAHQHGIISGYSCGPGCLEFRPGNNVTRGQVCKIVVLAEGWTIYTPPTPTFRDVPTTHTFYPYIETAYQHGIISGYSCGTGCLEFRPGNNATRGQLSKIVYQAVTQP